MRVLFIVVVFVSVSSCTPRVIQTVNRFDDPLQKQIATLQDKRDRDSLTIFLTAPDPKHRAAAVSAFGSIQDSSSVSALARLTQDTSDIVRKSLAFAIGQTPSQASLKVALANHNSAEEYLEAVGKTARSADSFTNIIPSDPLLLHSSHAWMLYAFSLMHPFDSVPSMLTKHSLREESPAALKIAITQFLARGVRHNDLFKSELIRCLQEDSSAEVRMNAAFALRRIRHDDVRHLLQNVSSEDPDYRVRVNAIRSLQAFPATHIIDQLVRALKDTVPNVTIAASEVIENIADSTIVKYLKPVIPLVFHWRTKANLMAAMAKAQPSADVRRSILNEIDSGRTSYEKAAMIRALQYDTSNYKFLTGWMKTDGNAPVIRSTSAMSLVQLLRRAHRNESLTRNVAAYIVSVIAEGDPAVIGILSEAVADTTLQLREYYPDASFLRNARSRLSLPRDVEAIQPLENAIAAIEGLPKPAAPVNPYNHPIDWQLVGKIRTGQKMVIETTRGDIVITLFVDEAPGTVANFAALADSGYFNGKFVHRVVPNFVVQTGCHRGDGWGSEDYSLRSEFTPRKFVTGSVGMASAGKDTEGTQWFITHSPAPHLDGRYTNFAQVVSGMDVVHQLEVGDKIISVRRY